MILASDIRGDHADSGPESIECPICHVNGVCTACKGCGRSGYFLRMRPRTGPPCRRCRGSEKCPHCSGRGAVLAFEPYIVVGTERAGRLPSQGQRLQVRSGDSSIFRTRSVGRAPKRSGDGWHGVSANIQRERRGMRSLRPGRWL